MSDHLKKEGCWYRFFNNIHSLSDVSFIENIFSFYMLYKVSICSKKKQCVYHFYMEVHLISNYFCLSLQLNLTTIKIVVVCDCILEYIKLMCIKCGD